MGAALNRKACARCACALGTNATNADVLGPAIRSSIENRARFLVEVVDAVTKVWPSDRVGVRIGPSNAFNEMHDSDPEALFSHVAAVSETARLPTST